MSSNNKQIRVQERVGESHAEWLLRMSNRSDAYHAHSSHPTSCEAYRDHYVFDCVCEQWTDEGRLP